jgi:hypothetical protein
MASSDQHVGNKELCCERIDSILVGVPDLAELRIDGRLVCSLQETFEFLWVHRALGRDPAHCDE